MAAGLALVGLAVALPATTAAAVPSWTLTGTHADPNDRLFPREIGPGDPAGCSLDEVSTKAFATTAALPDGPFAGHTITFSGTMTLGPQTSIGNEWGYQTPTNYGVLTDLTGSFSINSSPAVTGTFDGLAPVLGSVGTNIGSCYGAGAGDHFGYTGIFGGTVVALDAHVNYTAEQNGEPITGKLVLRDREQCVMLPAPWNQQCGYSGNVLNFYSPAVSPVPVDDVDPTVVVNAPTAGASFAVGASTVGVADYYCADNVALAQPDGCVASALDTSTVGNKVFIVTATDTSGNTAAVEVPYTVVPPPDTTDPTATINAPTNGANIVLGSNVTPDFACADETGGSGLASCVPSVATLVTATVGPKTFTVTATDNAGNTADNTVNYNVIYQHSGFLGSIDPDVVNTARAGSSIPVRFRLLDANGTPISDPSSFVNLTSALTPCNANEPTDAIEEYAAGGSGLQYLGDGYWQFNWKSTKSYAGKCRIVSLNLADGSHTTAKFQFS